MTIKIPNFNLICKYLVFITIFSCCFFTHNIYGIKLICFLLCIGIGIKSFFSKKYSKEIVITIYVGLLFPLYLTIISYLDNYDFLYAIRGSYCAVLFLIIIVALYYRVNIEKMSLIIFKMIVIIVLLCVSLDLIFEMDIEQNLVVQALKWAKEILVVAKSPKYYQYYKLYLASSPLLVLLASWGLDNKRYFWWLGSGVVLLFTGSITPFFAFIWESVFIFLSRKTKSRLSSIFILYSMILCLSFLMVTKLLVHTGASMIIRQSILEAFVDELVQDPFWVITGMGYGTKIYIPARRGFELVTEWSFLDFVRIYGVLGFVPFICILAYPLASLVTSNKQWVVYGVVSYLIIAFTNPFLYTTTGMVAYILLYYEYFLIAKNRYEGS